MADVGRLRITKESDGITARIKPKKDWFALCFIPFFLTAWTFGGISVIAELLKGEEHNPVFFLWLGFWVMVETSLIFALLWNVFGQEIVSIRRGLFTHKLAVGGIGVKKTFPVNELFNLRSSGFFDDSSREMDDRGWRKLGFADRTVAVDTKYVTMYRFGIRLEESEAATLAKALEPYFPSARYLMPLPAPDVD